MLNEGALFSIKIIYPQNLLLKINASYSHVNGIFIVQDFTHASYSLYINIVDNINRYKVHSRYTVCLLLPKVQKSYKDILNEL